MEVFSSFGSIPRSAIARSHGKICLVFKETANCLPKWLHHFAFPPTKNASSLAPHPVQHLVVSVFGILVILIVVCGISLFGHMNL